MIRDEVLTGAQTIINGDRAHDYGDATESFTRLAKLWSATLGQDVTPEQVALCLVQLKVSRLVNTPGHRDSWVDICGYAALGAEVAEPAVGVEAVDDDGSVTRTTAMWLRPGDVFRKPHWAVWLRVATREKSIGGTVHITARWGAEPDGGLMDYTLDGAEPVEVRA